MVWIFMTLWVTTLWVDGTRTPNKELGVSARVSEANAFAV
jgi:hypothetical protein